MFHLSSQFHILLKNHFLKKVSFFRYWLIENHCTIVFYHKQEQKLIAYKNYWTNASNFKWTLDFYIIHACTTPQCDDESITRCGSDWCIIFAYEFVLSSKQHIWCVFFRSAAQQFDDDDHHHYYKLEALPLWSALGIEKTITIVRS